MTRIWCAVALGCPPGSCKKKKKTDQGEDEKSVSELVSRCFKPSQPQRIISGLKETFIKRYTVERTNKAEIRLEEQSKKAESCRENSWNEI